MGVLNFGIFWAQYDRIDVQQHALLRFSLLSDGLEPVLVVILIWCVNVVLICGRHVKIHEIGLSIFFCGKFT